jgi:hypothetical protein
VGLAPVLVGAFAMEDSSMITPTEVSNLKSWLQTLNAKEMGQVLAVAAVVAGNFSPSAEVHAVRAAAALEQDRAEKSHRL